MQHLVELGVSVAGPCRCSLRSGNDGDTMEKVDTNLECPSEELITRGWKGRVDVCDELRSSAGRSIRVRRWWKK